MIPLPEWDQLESFNLASSKEAPLTLKGSSRVLGTVTVTKQNLCHSRRNLDCIATSFISIEMKKE
jgi:hypothetical protein